MKFENPIAEIHKFGLKDFISASSEVPAVETSKGYFMPGSVVDGDLCHYSKTDNGNFDNSR